MKNINENKRVEALDAYDLINKKPEDELNKITELAASICKAPVAKINLIGRDIQWTKSDFGSDEAERIWSVERDRSICQYTIRQKSILEIPNLVEIPVLKISLM